MADSQPSLIQDQARTGTFGGAQLDGTIKEGYQINAFVTPEEEETTSQITAPMGNIPESNVEAGDSDFLPAKEEIGGEAEATGNEDVARQLSNQELDEEA